MREIARKVEKLRYKTVEIPKLTRGIVRDSMELIGNTPLVRLNRITEGVKAEELTSKTLITLCLSNLKIRQIQRYIA